MARWFQRRDWRRRLRRAWRRMQWVIDAALVRADGWFNRADAWLHHGGE